MKFLFAFGLGAGLALGAQAQVQLGQARLQNSGRSPVPGVQVIFADAVPTTTDNAGNFRLVFEGKKPGDLIFKERIYKAGYEVVNERELDAPRLMLSRTDRLAADIILAQSGQVELAKKKYYAISDQALTAGFEQQRKALRSALQAAQLGQDAFAKQLTDLQEQYEAQKSKLSALADKFARVNFDDVGQLYAEALSQFQLGDLDGALAKLEASDLLGRADKVIQEDQRLELARREVDQQRQENQQRRQETIQGLQLQASLLLLKGEVGKVGEAYDQLVRLDSTKLDLLAEAAEYYNDYHRYGQARWAYHKIVAHPQAADWQKTDAYGHLVRLYLLTGQMDAALQTGLANQALCQAMYRVMDKERQSRPIYHIYTDWYLARSYQKLAEVYAEFSDLDKALAALQTASGLLRPSHADYPQDLLIKRSFMEANRELSRVHHLRNGLDSALWYAQARRQLAEELFLLDEHSTKAWLDFADAILALAEVYLTNQDLERALSAYEEAARLFGEFSAAQPYNIELRLGLTNAHKGAGDAHLDLGQLDQAAEYYARDLDMCRELAQTYPQNIVFKTNLLQAYAGLSYLEQLFDHTDKSLHLAKERQRLAEQYIGLMPSDQIAREEYAASLLDLGHNYLYFRQPDTALVYLQQAAGLLKGYAAERPDYWGHKPGLANVYFSLGEAYWQQGRRPQALHCYHLFGQSYAALATERPNTLIYRESHARAWQVTGETYSPDRPDSAHYCLAKYHQLAQEHYHRFPQWPAFFDQLWDSHLKLVNFFLDTDQPQPALAQAGAGLAWAREVAIGEPERAGLEELAARAALLAKQFAEAERYALAGLASDPARASLHSYVALAYLFQGDFERARQVYLAHKDTVVDGQKLRGAFLADLDYFSAQLEHSHPDLPKARRLLER
jgi:tetratricopeptide (TPR) repeat protein